MQTVSSQFIIAIVFYVAGILTGFFARTLLRDRKLEGNMLVLVVVSIIWSLSMIVELVNPAYKTNPLVHGLMGAIVGFFYKPKLGGGDDKPTKK